MRRPPELERLSSPRIPRVDALAGSRPQGDPSLDGRVEWLDGVRALAAIYVVLHHVWLMTYGGFPGNNGPWWTDWMIYGHIAVAVFIVVSGYSLTLGPSRHSFLLRGGKLDFVRRRFWRIVLPYWLALTISVILVYEGAIGTPSGDPLATKDVVIHASLFQDTFANVEPNGVFWSIAVEWHIYFFFALVLFGIRKIGAVSTGLMAFIGVTLIHVLSGPVPQFHIFDRFTPQFFVLFVFGVLAVRLKQRTLSVRVWAVAGAASIAGFFIATFVWGSKTIVLEYFWVDILVGFGCATIFVALSRGGLHALERVLSARPLTLAGSFAFSLYLMHAPILDLVKVHIIDPLHLAPTGQFTLLLGIGGPLAVIGAYLFFLAFERPFLRIRSLRQLASSLVAVFRKTEVLWLRLASRSDVRESSYGGRPGMTVAGETIALRTVVDSADDDRI